MVEPCNLLRSYRDAGVLLSCLCVGLNSVCLFTELCLYERNHARNVQLL